MRNRSFFNLNKLEYLKNLDQDRRRFFYLQEKTIKHVNTGSCLQKPDPTDVNLPVLRTCDFSKAQQWIMKSDFKWQASSHDDR